MMTHQALLGPAVLLLALPTMASAQSLPERLAQRATQPDVVLVPPVGEPSPMVGSFVVKYDGTDESRAGTYDIAPSSCSNVLEYKEVASPSTRSELWMVETGIGGSLGLPMLSVGGSWGKKSIAGIDYAMQSKMVVAGGLDKLEECCLRTPEACKDRYIAEYWKGTGAIHRLVASDSAIKATVKQLDKAGSLNFGASKGWSMAEKWEQPMYFAYRVQGFQIPKCESYMNNLPEVEGKLLFSGVSERLGSESKARENARLDARKQVVQYLGEELKVVGTEALSIAEGVLSGVKDGLTCMDPTSTSPEGPQYLARVRMYVDRADVEAAMATMKSGQKGGGAAPKQPAMKR